MLPELLVAQEAAQQEIRAFLDRLETAIIERIEKALSRRLVPEYVSISQAAKTTALSYSHVRRAVLSGELPASNIGSTRHPVYRIAGSDLAEWMEKKKGGSLKVPPKSELKELRDRYFPD